MKQRKGFSAIDPEKRRQIASLGGKAAHRKGVAHEWTSEEARAAGRRGGIVCQQKRKEQRRAAAV